MKIAVIGAGAMGCLYGGMLAEAGNDVWMLDVWEEHVDAINRKGLDIQRESGTTNVKNIKASTKASAVGEVDLAVLFVKSTLTQIAIDSNKDVIGKDTIVLTLQNGMGNIEKIANVAKRTNIIAGTTSHGSTMLGPGSIKHAGNGKTIIGELDGGVSPRLQNIVKVFNQSDIETEHTENVMGLIWSKLLVNVGINALTAITGMKNGELLQDACSEELMENVITEAWELAKVKEIDLNVSNPVEHAKKICELTSGNKSSMLQDIENHRKTEIDMINGSIVSEAEKLGYKAPYNKIVTNLVKTLEFKHELHANN